VLSSLTRRFAALPDWLVLLIGFACIAVIACLEYGADSRVPLDVVYLLPVVLVAWATESTGYGLIVAAVSCLLAPSGAIVAGFQSGSPSPAAWSGIVYLGVFCVVLLLMEQGREAILQLQRQALVDELTGVANLRAFREAAVREIRRSTRFGHELSLAYVDIDDFKAVNDRLGHEAGDRMLVALAGLTLATVRTLDFVARIGGDEFVILMPETGVDGALPVVVRLREAFARAGAATCSIGLASSEGSATSVEEMLAAADALMYEAKQAGKNTVRHRALGQEAVAAEPGRLLAFSPAAGA
jgi:diguanylate cyclase (GGDEF)-like protein